MWTESAFKRQFARMKPSVLCQISGITELLSTHVTQTLHTGKFCGPGGGNDVWRLRVAGHSNAFRGFVFQLLMTNGYRCWQFPLCRAVKCVGVVRFQIWQTPLLNILFHINDSSVFNTISARIHSNTAIQNLYIASRYFISKLNNKTSIICLQTFNMVKTNSLGCES